MELRSTVNTEESHDSEFIDLSTSMVHRTVDLARLGSSPCQISRTYSGQRIDCYEFTDNWVRQEA